LATAELFQIKPSTNPEREGANNCPQKLMETGQAQAFYRKKEKINGKKDEQSEKKKLNTPPPSMHRGHNHWTLRDENL